MQCIMPGSSPSCNEDDEEHWLGLGGSPAAGGTGRAGTDEADGFGLLAAEPPAEHGHVLLDAQDAHGLEALEALSPGGGVKRKHPSGEQGRAFAGRHCPASGSEDEHADSLSETSGKFPRADSLARDDEQRRADQTKGWCGMQDTECEEGMGVDAYVEDDDEEEAAAAAAEAEDEDEDEQQVRSKPHGLSKFWSAEATRDLRNASELNSQELSETVVAIEFLTAEQSGVQCVAHHPHGPRLLEALVLALESTSKVALKYALEGSAAHASDAGEDASQRDADSGNGRNDGTVSYSDVGDETRGAEPEGKMGEGEEQGCTLPAIGAAKSTGHESTAGEEGRQIVATEDERNTCLAAVNALCNISGCAAGRKWLANQPDACEGVIASLCALMHDHLPGWEVTDLAAASTLGLSNLLCSKTISARCVATEPSTVSVWAAAGARGASTAEYSVCSADSGRTSTTRSRGSGTLVRGLVKQLSHFPSHGAVSAATAIGNLARREGGIDILLASSADAAAVIDDLADMVLQPSLLCSILI